MFLRSITLKNLLSFKDTTLDLRPLNVIIGPNGAGKSNLIDAIGLLRAAPGDLVAPLRASGAPDDWFWAGDRGGSAAGQAGALVARSTSIARSAIELEFGKHGQVVRERLAPDDPTPEDPRSFFSRHGHSLEVAVPVKGGVGYSTEQASADAVHSALSSLRTALVSPESTALGARLSSIRIYRHWRTEPGSPMRVGVAAKAVGDESVDGGSNLALVLNEIRERAGVPAASTTT